MPKIAKSPYDVLRPTIHGSGHVNVVIETPKGCRNKYKYDEESRLFRLSSVLPAGSAFPYDFGYVPGTRAEDGDPIDVLLLMDQPAFTGCLVESRIIGVIEAEQSEEGKMERNDRLVAVAIDAHDFRDLNSLKEMNEHLLQELEHFFVSYNQLKGKEFKLVGTKGPRAALKLLKGAIAKNK